MKSQIVLAVILLATLSTIGTSQVEPKQENKLVDLARETEQAEEERIAKLDLDVQSLLGLDGIYVWLGELTEDQQTTGLTVSQLRTEVELKLRLAGIKVCAKEELKYFELPQLCVNLTSLSHRFGWSYCIEVALKQGTVVVRKPHPVCLATTWNRTVVATCPIDEFKEAVRENVRDSIDVFINAYLTANPKN